MQDSEVDKIPQLENGDSKIPTILQKELCRRQKGGKNREKTKLKLAKAHKRIADVRADHLHKLTMARSRL